MDNNQKQQAKILLQGMAIQKHLRPNRGLVSKGLNIEKEVKNKQMKNPQKQNKQKTTLPTENHVNLEAVRTLEELKDALNQLDHPLKDASNRLVFGTPMPSKHPKIMAIGEAPGEEEDKQGEPFVGASGQLLSDILKQIGLDRKKNLYITNIVPWRPIGNRTPTAEEVRFFLPYIKKHIELIDPELIILVGSTSYKAFFPDGQAISKVRGNFLEYGFKKMFVVFHPSYLLRVPSAKKIMWQDMLLLKQFIQNNGLLP